MWASVYQSVRLNSLLNMRTKIKHGSQGHITCSFFYLNHTWVCCSRTVINSQGGGVSVTTWIITELFNYLELRLIKCTWDEFLSSLIMFSPRANQIEGSFCPEDVPVVDRGTPTADSFQERSSSPYRKLHHIIVFLCENSLLIKSPSIVSFVYYINPCEWAVTMKTIIIIIIMY